MALYENQELKKAETRIEEAESPSEQVLSTVVLNQYHVSTSYRRSSSAINPCYYYETIVFKFDNKLDMSMDKKLVSIITGGPKKHFEMVQKVLSGERLDVDDDEPLTTNTKDS